MNTRPGIGPIAGFLCAVLLGGVLLTARPAVAGAQQRQSPNRLDTAVSLAVLSQGQHYLAGECLTEGHIILADKTDNGRVTVYTLASVGWFGFENGIFAKISGSGAIPTVVTFARGEGGEYRLVGYQEPGSGSDYDVSLQQLFPVRLWAQAAQAGSRYAELARQQEIQAVAYLKSIGRAAEVRAAYVEKRRLHINGRASNKLLAEQAQDDGFLNHCPSWIGTRERIEQGVRYIYETAQSIANEGYDLVIFRKFTVDGTLVEERKYQIVGTEPRLVD